MKMRWHDESIIYFLKQLQVEQQPEITGLFVFRKVGIDTIVQGKSLVFVVFSYLFKSE